MNMTTEDQKVETPKGLTLVDLRIRGSNRSSSKTELPTTLAVDSTLANADWTRCNAMDVVKRDIRHATAIRLNEIEGRMYEEHDQGTLNLQDLKADLLLLAQIHA